MAFVTNPVLNQKLMQLDQEYAQQRANLIQSSYTQPQQNNWNQNNAQQSQPPQTNQGLLWVQGETGAKSYLMAPNTTVLLMDSEGSRFYLKSTDNAGMPSLRTFEYKEVVQSTSQVPQTSPEDLDNKYVTRGEYEDLRGQYAEILDKLNSFHADDSSGGAGKGTATANTGKRTKGGNGDE